MSNVGGQSTSIIKKREAKKIGKRRKNREEATFDSTDFILVVDVRI